MLKPPPQSGWLKILMHPHPVPGGAHRMYKIKNLKIHEISSRGQLID